MKCRKLHIYSCQRLAQRLPKFEFASTQEQMKTLDRAFYKLDLDVQRNARLYFRDVENVFNNIQQMGTVNSSHALLLIRCCGEILQDETLSSRIELTNKVWKMITDLNCQMDVSHYNALLKVYLENEYKFLPTDFLASMEQAGIQPNRVTYQRLVTRYCQDGDIEGASKVLEFMKEKELPVNEMIFNSLVMGHTKSGDMAGAREILEVMRNAKLDPSARTYSALACGYARSGDIDGLQQVLKEAEQNEVFLMDDDYLDIIRSLAISGNSQHVTEIIPKLPKLMGYIQHCMSTIFELVNEGHEDVGFTLLKTMTRTLLPNGELAPSGNFFIRQLVRRDVPLEKVLHYCQEMKQLNLNEKALVKAVEFSLSHHKPDLAVPLLRKMHEEGYSVRSHYFWPILVSLRNKSDEATYNILQLMTEMQCPLTMDTYSDYALPNLNTDDPDIIIQKIKDFGETVGSIVNALVRYYLVKNSPSMAVSLIEKYPVRLSVSSLHRPLAIAYKETGETSIILKILKHLKDNPELGSTQSVTDCCGLFIIAYIYMADQDKAKLTKLLQEMKSLGFQISYSSLETIMSSLADSSILQNNLKLLKSMASTDIDPNQDTGMPHPRSMSVENLEDHLVELKDKGMNTRGVLRRLLLDHCRTRNYSRAMEIKNEMENLGMDFTPALYSQLMNLSIAKDNLEEALQYKGLIEATPDFVLDDFKVLNLAALLVTNDQFDDAKNLILSYKDKFIQRKDLEYLTRNVVRVLQAAADKGDVPLVKEFYELLVVRMGFTSPNARILSQIIRAHVMNDDIQGALEAFEDFSNQHKVTAYRNELCKKLIDADDSENLQKVLDTCIKIHGEINALHDLAGSFIHCGRVKQAKKVFETPGLRARNNKLEKLCEHFLELNKPESILHLIDATDRLFEVNKEKMYWYLLRTYVKLNDVQKALGVWTTMQEVDIVPSYKTLIFLADFLKKNGQPIPFTIPSDPVSFDEVDDEEQGPPNSISDLLRMGHLNEALEEKKRMEENNKILGLSISSSLIEALVKNDRILEAVTLTEEMLARGQYPVIRVFRFLLSRMANLGDVESISALCQHMTPENFPKLRPGDYMSRAYMNSNRHMELLKQWEDDTKGVNENTFSLGGYLGMLHEHPNLEDRLLKIADRMAEEGSLKPLNIVWMYFLVNNQFERASVVFKRLQDNSELMFRTVLKHAFENKNENLSSELTRVAKIAKIKPTAKGALFGCHMEVLVALGKTDEAVAILQDAMTSCGLTESDFNRNSLKRLQSALMAHGKEVPFVIPTSQVKRDEDSSSSSSDDEN